MDGADVIGPGPNRGVIFQQYALFPWMTVKKNIKYGMKFLKKPDGTKYTEEEKEKIAQEYIKQVNLTGFENSYPKELSGGMKQRLLLAQALLGDPSILILDEPTAGLDPKERIRLRNYIADLGRNKIVLLATHIVSDIETIAGQVVLMQDGKLVRQGSVEELLEEMKEKQVTPIGGNLSLEDVYLYYLGGE